MKWNTFFQCKESLSEQYKTAYDQDNHLKLKSGCEKIRLQMINEPKNLVKAYIFAYILENATLEVHPDEIFADCIHHYDLIGDLRMLRIIAHHGRQGIIPSQLAERMEVALPTVSRKLNVLEKQRLIERKPCKTDKRKSFIYILESRY